MDGADDGAGEGSWLIEARRSRVLNTSTGTGMR